MSTTQSTWWGGNNYSEEEQVIGTWIDGKPIYQKTIVLPTNLRFQLNGTWQNICDSPSTDIKELLDCKLSVLNNQGTGFEASFLSLNSICYDAVQQKIKGFSTGSSAYVDIKNITVQYTKTTD